MSDPAIALQAIESPCIQICTLNAEGVCIGCFRTADEIGGWLSLSAGQRSRIMNELSGRAEQLFEAD